MPCSDDRSEVSKNKDEKATIDQVRQPKVVEAQIISTERSSAVCYQIETFNPLKSFYASAIKSLSRSPLKQTQSDVKRRLTDYP